MLSDPTPVAILKAFADSGIDLELYVWIEDPEAGKGTCALTFNRAMWKSFNANGIAIPFPQREIRILRLDNLHNVATLILQPADLRSGVCPGVDARKGRLAVLEITCKRAAILHVARPTPLPRKFACLKSAVAVQCRAPKNRLMNFNLIWILPIRICSAGSDPAAVVGLCGGRAGLDPHHDCSSHHLPAPLSGAPRAGTASGGEPFLPLLAVAHHRHGDQGVGGGPPQAPRQVRDRGRSAQPAGLRACAKCCWKAPSCIAIGAADAETLTKYGHGTPDDWIERNLYSRHSVMGVALMMVIDLVLFGFAGLTIWAVQMVWIPVFAAGVINGVGHYSGYRNFQTRRCEHQHRALGHPDRRRGTAQQSPRLCLIGPAVEQVVRVRHRLALYPRCWRWSAWRRSRSSRRRSASTSDKARCDLQTLQAVITHRYDVVQRYARTLHATLAEERADALQTARARRGRSCTSSAGCTAMQRICVQHERERMEEVLKTSKVLATVYSMRQELSAVWARSTASKEQLLHQLEDWCHRAEKSGIVQLAQVLADAARGTPEPEADSSQTKGPAFAGPFSSPRRVQLPDSANAVWLT